MRIILDPDDFVENDIPPQLTGGGKGGKGGICGIIRHLWTLRDGLA